MSDPSVPVAPPPNAPPVSEVPINPDQPSTPSPITNAPPEKPAAPPSRREAIQAAFDKATRQQDGKEPLPKKAAPKAAEARMGHNQPPEPTENEEIDLKKRPSDQPRGERGQFTPRQAEQMENKVARRTDHDTVKPGTAQERNCRRTRPIEIRRRGWPSMPSGNGLRRRRACAAKCTACMRNSATLTIS